MELPDGRHLKYFYYGSGHLLSLALDNLPISDFTRDELHREVGRTQGLLTSRNEYDRLGRIHRRDVFTGNAQRPAPARWSRRWDYDYRNNPVREERDDDPFNGCNWKYDSAGRLLEQDGTLPGKEQWRWDAAGNPLDNSLQQSVRHNRLTRLNGIQWSYDIHGRTTEKDNGQTRWLYRYDGEHRLTDVVAVPRDRNKPQTQVSFRYDPLGRRISKTRQQTLGGRPVGKQVTTRFQWEGFRLLQEIHDDVPLTYVYSDAESYEPLARIDGTEDPDIFWFHCQPNGTPERMSDREGHIRWEGQNSAWGKLLHESIPQETGYAQNLRMQGQYLDRETGLHYNLFRYYDPDSARFTQQDPIGLAGGINLYQYAPNALGWVDPWGLSRCSGGTRLTVNKPKILSSTKLSSTERKFLERQFMKKMNALNRAAQRGELVWSPGTHEVRISSLQSSYRQAVSARFEKMFGSAPDLSKLNADHPVDLIVGGSPTQRLQMLNETINKSVGSSLKNAGRKAGLQPGDAISEIIFQ